MTISRSVPEAQRRGCESAHFSVCVRMAVYVYVSLGMSGCCYVTTVVVTERIVHVDLHIGG